MPLNLFVLIATGALIGSEAGSWVAGAGVSLWTIGVLVIVNALAEDLVDRANGRRR